MKTLCCEISDELHSKIKMYALVNGKTMKQYVLDLITQDMEKTKKEKE